MPPDIPDDADSSLIDHEALAFYRFLAQGLAAVPPDTRDLSMTGAMAWIN